MSEFRPYRCPGCKGKRYATLKELRKHTDSCTRYVAHAMGFKQTFERQGASHASRITIHRKPRQAA